jgi:hypothetical protein
MLIDSNDRSSRDGRSNRKKMLFAFAAVPSLKTMKKCSPRSQIRAVLPASWLHLPRTHYVLRSVSH